MPDNSSHIQTPQSRPVITSPSYVTSAPAYNPQQMHGRARASIRRAGRALSYTARDRTVRDTTPSGHGPLSRAWTVTRPSISRGGTFTIQQLAARDAAVSPRSAGHEPLMTSHQALRDWPRLGSRRSRSQRERASGCGCGSAEAHLTGHPRAEQPAPLNERYSSEGTRAAASPHREPALEVAELIHINVHTGVTSLG